jgi:hypothetical protein
MARAPRKETKVTKEREIKKKSTKKESAPKRTNPKRSTSTPPTKEKEIKEKTTKVVKKVFLRSSFPQVSGTHEGKHKEKCD